MYSFEDSRITEIDRKGNHMVISLDQAHYGKGKDAIIIDNPKIVITDVLSETVRFYVGEKVEGKHPNPSLPLDSIEMCELAKDKLLLAVCLIESLGMNGKFHSNQIHFRYKMGNTHNKQFKTDTYGAV